MMDFLESKAQVKVAHLIISSSSAWHPTRPSTMVESVRLGHWNIWGMLGPGVTEMPVKHLHDGPPARSLKEQLSRADSCREVGPRPLLVSISSFLFPLIYLEVMDLFLTVSCVSTALLKGVFGLVGRQCQVFWALAPPPHHSWTTRKRPIPFPLSLLQPYSLHRCLLHCEIKIHYSHSHPHIQPIYQWSNLPRNNKLVKNQFLIWFNKLKNFYIQISVDNSYHNIHARKSLPLRYWYWRHRLLES